MSGEEGGFTSASQFTINNIQPRGAYKEVTMTSAAQTVIYSADPSEFISVQAVANGVALTVDSTNQLHDTGDMSESTGAIDWVEEQASAVTDYSATDTRGITGLRFVKPNSITSLPVISIVSYKDAK